MKITEYPEATSLTGEDVILFDGANGTKKMRIDEFKYQIDCVDGPEVSSQQVIKRNAWRGKNLGPVFTAAQHEAIQNRDYSDYFIGDYWWIGGIRYRIADISPWGAYGSPAFSSPHLVIVPDHTLAEAKFHNSTTLPGGYLSADIRSVGLASVRNIVNNAFPGALLKRYELLNNSIVSNIPMGAAWVEVDVELLTERLLFGHPIYGVCSDGSSTISVSQTYPGQLPLFRMFSNLTKAADGKSYWLRDFSALNRPCFFGTTGISSYGEATAILNIRPVFAIG